MVAFIKRIAFFTLSTIICLELILRVIDPYGAFSHYNDTLAQQSVVVNHPTGYAYETGVYDWRVFDATILRDGLRFVPDSLETSNCTIAFIGDSFTFGQGVHDNETIANYTAQSLGVRVLNTGRNGYNASQVLQEYHYYEADIYVYLAIPNDITAPLIPTRSMNRTIPALQAYWISLSLALFGMPNWNDQTNLNPIALGAMRDLVSKDDVLSFAIGTNALFGISFNPLPDFAPEYVSTIDKHANAEGNRILFEGMRDYLIYAIQKDC